MPSSRIFEITAEDANALDEVRQLFVEYAEWLSPFVTASTLAEELVSLPEPFASPGGRLLAARDASGAICGCVGIRRHSETECEIKRLFVRPGCRGGGLGQTLFSAALDVGCDLGYRGVLVSTIPDFMPAANRMYERIGFAPTECFEHKTQASAEIRYLRYDLAQWCP